MNYLIAKKVGMTSIFQKDGKMIPVTVFDVKDNYVLGYRKLDKDGYVALRLARGIDKKEKNINFF